MSFISRRRGGLSALGARGFISQTLPPDRVERLRKAGVDVERTTLGELTETFQRRGVVGAAATERELDRLTAITTTQTLTGNRLKARRARQAKGRRQTILTGPQGVLTDTVQTGKKTLLGE